MKLKSSNKATYFLLTGLLILIVLLALLKGVYTKKKPSKYISAPETIEQKTTLNFIQLTFNEKSYKKLKKKKNKALELGILETSDSDYVPATVTFNSREYRAEVRLKGDWIDHLRGDKWSFRIKLKDDQTIMGMRKFSIHRPGTRGFINEWLYHKAIKDEDLIGLRYDFLEGVIHIKEDNSSNYITKNVGIYAIEESFDKRTIESNKRKESVILKFSEDPFWNNVKISKRAGNLSGIEWKAFMDYNVDYPISVFGESKVLKDEAMYNYFATGKSLLLDAYIGNKRLDQVFDVKELAMQNAILNLFGAIHGLPLINVRYYYNPITSKLEPIAFDGNSGQLLDTYKHVPFLNKKSDTIYLKELAYALNKVYKPSYLSSLLNKYKNELSNYKLVLKKEFKWNLLNVSHLKSNQEVLKDELKQLKERFNLTEIIIDSVSFENLKTPVPKIDLWRKKGVSLKAIMQNKSIYKIERTDINNNAYVAIKDIKIESNNLVQISILVKPATEGEFFGLRIQGKYPSRTDAVFNLKKGVLKGVKSAGGFSLAKAEIKPLSNGWFELKIEAKSNTNKINLLFGPASAKSWVLQWERPSNKKLNALIDISGIKIEQLDQQ